MVFGNDSKMEIKENGRHQKPAFGGELGILENRFIVKRHQNG
jgi:hypothetical protein